MRFNYEKIAGLAVKKRFLKSFTRAQEKENERST
jgi:hypothetical protein